MGTWEDTLPPLMKEKLARIGEPTPEEKERYGIMSIPTLLVFKDGELVDQVVGAMPRGALESQLTRHIQEGL